MKPTWALLFLLLVSVAQAAPRPSQRDGRRHHARGMARYALLDFEGAIREFRTAYELTHAAALLFNLAQASRLARKHEDALHFYRGYLRAIPDAANRADAEKFIDELEPLVRGEQLATVDLEALRAPAPIRAPMTSPASTVPAVVVAPVEPARALLRAPQATLPPARVRKATPFLVAGGTIAGLGAAALATGLYFGFSARSAASQLSGLARMEGTWSAGSQRLLEDGRSDARLATVLDAFGGAVLGVGVIVAIVGAVRRPRPAFALGPDVVPGSAPLQAICTF